MDCLGVGELECGEHFHLKPALVLDTIIIVAWDFGPLPSQRHHRCGAPPELLSNGLGQPSSLAENLSEEGGLVGILVRAAVGVGAEWLEFVLAGGRSKA